MFDVFAENIETVDLFQMVGTQWRLIPLPMGGVIYQGIDYGSLDRPMKALNIPRKRENDVFTGLRLMEIAAREVLNAKKE